MTRHLTSPRAKDPRGLKAGNHRSAMIYPQKSHTDTVIFTISYWFYGSEPLSIPVHNGRIIQEQDYQEVRIIGAIPEAILDAGQYVLLCQLRIPFPLHLTSSHIFQYPTWMSRTLWSLPQIIRHFLLCVYIELCSISINHLSPCILIYFLNVRVCLHYSEFLREGRLRLNILTAPVSAKYRALA